MRELTESEEAEKKIILDRKIRTYKHLALEKNLGKHSFGELSEDEDTQ